jgi:hypothetical protein
MNPEITRLRSQRKCALHIIDLAHQIGEPEWKMTIYKDRAWNALFALNVAEMQARRPAADLIIEEI